MTQDTIGISDAAKSKEEGNEAFKAGDWEKAITCYTKSIKLAVDENSEKAIYYKNRAAAHLKKGDFNSAYKDCTAALDICSHDPKALFRRCQALDGLERFEEAYKDARLLHTVDPGNKALQPILAKLHQIVQERIQIQSQTTNRVAQMFNYAFDFAVDQEKRETALNNLLVLAKEKAGADAMMGERILARIQQLVKVEKNVEIIVSAVRIVSELCKHSSERSKTAVSELGIPWILDILNSRKETQVNAAQYCLQTILNALSGLENKDDSKPDKELCQQNKKEIDTMLACLVYSTTSRTISGLARDAVIELIMRNVHYTALDWAERLVEVNGLQRLMEVASELQEYKYESAMEITDNTRMTITLCLARVYENMYYDKAKETYCNKIDEFIKERLLTPDIESKVRVTVAITTLLLGPHDVGNTFIAKPGIMEMILVMAGTDDELQQKVACEAIIAAASKKDKVRSIVTSGVNILKKLYQSKNDSIRVRALVGLCKLGSSGGSDASIRPFADGATMKLAEACRRFLINPAKDRDMRRWAAEGLSYLTLDAEVKEKLIEDRAALQAMIELAKTGSESVVYGVVTTIVNLVNAYDKQEVIPEMVELAKFAKHHIPEEHEFDDPDFVAKRIEILCKEGVTTALVSLSKTESKNSKELIGRVFNAICEQQELRGLVVQHGGAKVLVPMALEGTDKGKKQAAQALARIGITINPEVAFPGQRMCEIVRPLTALLHPECTALENFEALMALCNLAGVNETVRQRILNEQGLSKIEAYMYEEHVLLRRAAVQAVTNMLLSPDVIKMYEGENDRAKFLVLLCGEEDLETVKAASGALAILTGTSAKSCSKVFQTDQWIECFRMLLANPDLELQKRGAAIVLNMMDSDKDVAEKLICTDIMEILMALTKIEEAGREKVREYAELALKAAEKWKLIQKAEGQPQQEEEHDSDVE